MASIRGESGGVQTILPGLVALAQRAHYMVGPGLAWWASEDELEQEIVITEGLTDALAAGDAGTKRWPCLASA